MPLSAPCGTSNQVNVSDPLLRGAEGPYTLCLLRGSPISVSLDAAHMTAIVWTTVFAQLFAVAQ